MFNESPHTEGSVCNWGFQLTIFVSFKALGCDPLKATEPRAFINWFVMYTINKDRTDRNMKQVHLQNKPVYINSYIPLQSGLMGRRFQGEGKSVEGG